MRRSTLFLVSILVVLSMILPATAPAAEPVTVEWWHIWPNEPLIYETFQDLADQFMADNPGVTIEITQFENEAFKQKIATVMQSGEPPDIFQSWGGGVLGAYAKAGLVQDLTPSLAENGWGDSMSSGALAIFQIDGKNYSVPWRAGMFGIFYNKELFAKAGIENPPATWTELLDDVKKLKDAGITPIALGEGDKWPGMSWWAYLLARMASPEEILGATDRTGSFDSPGFVAAGEKLDELIALEPFQTGFLGTTYDEAEALMANGQAAMQLMGHWGYGYSAGSLAEDPDAYNAFIGWMPFPAVEGGNGDPTAVYGGGDSFAVGKDAPPEAIEFVRFLLSPEVHQRLVDNTAVPLPIVMGVTPSYANPLFEQMAEQIGQAKFVLNYLDQQFPAPLDSAVNDEVQKLFAGTATPAEVAASLEDLAKKNLDQ